MMKIITTSIACLLLTAQVSRGEQLKTKEYRGVVTYQLLPAKVIRINEIIKDPKPGTSYIGEKSILVEVDENPKVMANWTVVKIKYYEYEEPKTIKYKLLSEEAEIAVNYHAVSVTIDGDLSAVIKKE